MVAYQENSEGKTLEESLSEMTAQKSECSFRLRTHEENKRKIAGFQQELSERRAMSERWAKLKNWQARRMAPSSVGSPKATPWMSC